jgi:acetyl-CoA synthetase
MHELLPAQRPYCPAEPMDSEDILFILYTSGSPLLSFCTTFTEDPQFAYCIDISGFHLLVHAGSTGRPKGLVHSTAGYLTYSAMTCKYTFDLREGDVYACVADCGWSVHYAMRACMSIKIHVFNISAHIRITGHSYIVYGPLVNGVTRCLIRIDPEVSCYSVLYVTVLCSNPLHCTRTTIAIGI